MTTDFGLTEEFVGVMKGVILTIAPAVQIVDITHGISHQNVRQAAFTIASAARYFPHRTVHMVVVDPEVGGQRKIIAVSAADQIFLAPDNGVLTPILDHRDFECVHEVSREDLFLRPVSHTFHGRDLFAPVAANLAMGMQVHEVGNILPAETLRRITLPEVRFVPEQGELHGEVIGADHFGNLFTNIERQDLFSLVGEGPGPRPTIRVGSWEIKGIKDTYQEATKGSPLAIFGSRDRLEIAINCGNAAARMNIGIGARVSVTILRDFS